MCFQVDLLRTVSLPHLQLFGVSDGLELRVSSLFLDMIGISRKLPFRQIKKRGASPLGGGEVQFLCPIIKQAKTINFVDPGRIKRIRGIAYVLQILNYYFHYYLLNLPLLYSLQTCRSGQPSILAPDD